MLSLTDLRARQVVPAWQEAVAVVQELIQAVAQTQGRDAQLPDIDHIALIANGEVVALPGSGPTGNPVGHAARVLEQLLDGVAAPPELVALVNDNATDSPKLPSLAELTRQLAFFERPGRRSDVEQLVSRAMSADAQDRAEEELRRLKDRTLLGADLDAFQTEADLAKSTKKKERRQVNRQAMVVLALILAVLVAGGGWWVYARVFGGPPQVTSAGPDAPPPAEEGAEAGIQPDPAAADAGAGQPAETPDAEAAADRSASAKTPSFLERTGASIRRAMESAFGSTDATEDETAATTDTSEPTAEPAASPRPRVRRSPSAGSAVAEQTPAEAAPVQAPQVSTTVEKPPIEGDPVSVGTVSGDARSTVYSRDDLDVRPAMLLRPVLPATPPPDVPPDQIGTLELVVDEYGDVEHVRLLSPANRFHERMLVSHAKTWKFRPAIRDGQPVKYRTVIRLTI